MAPLIGHSYKTELNKEIDENEQQQNLQSAPFTLSRIRFSPTRLPLTAKERTSLVMHWANRTHALNGGKAARSVYVPTTKLLEVTYRISGRLTNRLTQEVIRLTTEFDVHADAKDWNLKR